MANLNLPQPQNRVRSLKHPLKGVRTRQKVLRLQVKFTRKRTPTKTRNGLNPFSFFTLMGMKMHSPASSFTFPAAVPSHQEAN